MRIDRFRAKDVHGYLDIDVKFRGNLSLLTGINGSGKTTTLNSIVALLTPDLQTLTTLTYGFLEVQIENEGSKHLIRSELTPDGCQVNVDGQSDKLIIRRYSDDPDLPSYKQVEHEQEFHRAILLENSQHPTLRLISSLPTPMFLGLDRRSRFEHDDRRLRSLPNRSTRVGRNVSGASLSRSLHDAAALASTRYRDTLIATGRIGDELRRELILTLLTLPAQQPAGFSVPTSAELQELRRIRRDISSIATILSLPRSEVEARLTPFLDELERAAGLIPLHTRIEQIISSKNPDARVLQAAFSWGANKSQLDRMRSILGVIEGYNVRTSSTLEPLENYKKLVNGFLNEVGKSVSLDERGDVFVNIDGVDGQRDIASLSSGEAQIFVILTHLAFSREAQRANVFIVDEPELSLHVTWQELFVNSVLQANPNIQYVMATHSPSIILGRVKDCVDMSRGASR